MKVVVVRIKGEDVHLEWNQVQLWKKDVRFN